MTAALWAARALALAGFLDAAYLTAVHYSGGAVACGPSGGCEFVLTSRWATVGGVPIAAIGAGYYALASVLAWTPGSAWTRTIALLLAGLAGVAVVVSGILFWVQASVVDAWCRFCLLSAALTTALFVAALVLVRAAPRPGADGTG